MSNQIQSNNFDTTAQVNESTNSIWSRYQLLMACVILMLLTGGVFFALDVQTGDSLPVQVEDGIPEIMFLGPADRAVLNVYRIDPQNGTLRQVTDVPEGVHDYVVSPDGEWIAYVVQVTGIYSDIWVLNLETNQQIQLTNCREADASCSTPSWRYDSAQIAYTRRELDRDNGRGNTDRVWLVDLVSRESRPLFDDLEAIGRYPVWSPVAEQVALSLADPPGIIIYDFPTDDTLFVPSASGITGWFTADGTGLLYPALRFGEVVQYYYSHLEMIVLDDETNTDNVGVLRVTGETTTPVTDGQGAVHPNGNLVAVTRQYLDQRRTEGSQIYLIDLSNDSVEPLIVDSTYAHASVRWNSDGRYLLYQRTNLSDYRQIEIWIYDMEHGEAQRIHDSGLMPRFLHD